MSDSTTITRSTGLSGRTSRGTDNYGLAARLDATEHVERQSHRGDDGYTVMDDYNRVLPATVCYRQPGGSRPRPAAS